VLETVHVVVLGHLDRFLRVWTILKGLWIHAPGGCRGGAGREHVMVTKAMRVPVALRW
jgi:hypothetical protein